MRDANAGVGGYGVGMVEDLLMQAARIRGILVTEMPTVRYFFDLMASLEASRNVMPPICLN